MSFARVDFSALLGDYVAAFVRGNCETDADSLDLTKVTAKK